MIDVTYWKEYVNEGWHDLLDKMFDRIEYEVAKQEIEDFGVLQVKEKFGLLRVYVAPWNQECDDIIQQAVRESSYTCEFCGKHGHLQSIGSWLKTVCDSCKKRIESLPSEPANVSVEQIKAWIKSRKPEDPYSGQSPG